MYASAAALALRDSGRALVEIDVRVNDGAALIFIETCRHLIHCERLKKVTIAPIWRWKGATTEAVQSFMTEITHLQKS